MSGAPPPQPGTAGTDDDPLDIETDVLELLNNAAGVATVENLVGVAADSTSTDGTLVYPTANGAQGVPTDLAVRIDGVNRPVTAIEYADATGTLRPVTQWHLGPLGEFTLTLDSLTVVQPATFDVRIASTTSSVKPGNTLDVTVDVTNTGDETGTQTVTLDIGGVGQVDSQGVPLTGGQSSTTTLSWSVPGGQTEQDYQSTVASADDTASQTVTVSDATVGTIDDFEDNDIAEYSGDTGNFTTASSPTTSGAYSLEADEGSNTTGLDRINAYMYSTSVSNTPARGYEFKWDFYYGGTDDQLSMLFCVQDANNFYYAGADNNQELWVKKVSGGSVTKSTVGTAASGSYDPNTWYTATVQVQSGGTITYNDSNSGSSQISLTDSEYGGGGIGWAVDSGGPGYFDNARITQDL